MTIASPTFSSIELDSAKDLTPSISGPDEQARFVQYCITYYADWFKYSKSRIDGGAVAHDQAVLLLYAQVPDVSTGIPDYDDAALKRVYKAAYSIELGIFVADETLRSVYRIPAGMSSSDDLIEFALESLSDQQTFVIMLMAKRAILVHHAGEPLASWIEDPLRIPFNDAINEPNLASIDDQLKRYQHAHTSTHRGYTARLMWKHDDKGRPRLKPAPELQVQTTLLTQLQAWYRQASVIVQEEISNTGGRVDIQLTRASTEGIVKSTIELKILKPHLNEKDNVAWAVKGIDQAKGYLDPHESDFSMTCLFDARIDKSAIFEALEAYASESSVELRHFPMDPPPEKTPKAPKPRNSRSGKTVEPPSDTDTVASDLDW